MIGSDEQSFAKYSQHSLMPSFCDQTLLSKQDNFFPISIGREGLFEVMQVGENVSLNFDAGDLCIR